MSNLDIPFRNWGYAFEGPSWWQSKFRVIKLERVFRQKGDAELVNFLDAVRKGDEVHRAYTAIVNELQMNDGKLPPLPGGVKPTTLFPTRNEADLLNLSELNALDHDAKVFDASDEVMLNGRWKKKLARRFQLDQPPINASCDKHGKPDGGFVRIWKKAATPDENELRKIKSSIEASKKEKEREFELKHYNVLKRIIGWMQIRLLISFNLF